MNAGFFLFAFAGYFKKTYLDIYIKRCYIANFIHFIIFLGKNQLSAFNQTPQQKKTSEFIYWIEWKNNNTPSVKHYSLEKEVHWR